LTILYVAPLRWGVRVFGLGGAGIAFMLSYVFHALIVYPMVRSMTGFRWSGENLRAGSAFVLACGATMMVQRGLPQWPALAFGTCLTLASLWYCVRTLAKLSTAEDSLPAIRRILRLGRKL
jgi:PST family polysaccharide transporter